MNRVKIAELKARLSAVLRAVEKGERVEVTDRDRPIATLIPYREAVRGPAIRPAELPFKKIRDRRYAAARWPMRSLDLLTEERGDR